MISSPSFVGQVPGTCRQFLQQVESDKYLKHVITTFNKWQVGAWNMSSILSRSEKCLEHVINTVKKWQMPGTCSQYLQQLTNVKWQVLSAWNMSSIPSTSDTLQISRDMKVTWTCRQNTQRVTIKIKWQMPVTCQKEYQEYPLSLIKKHQL